MLHIRIALFLKFILDVNPCGLILYYIPARVTSLFLQSTSLDGEVAVSWVLEQLGRAEFCIIHTLNHLEEVCCSEAVGYSSWSLTSDVLVGCLISTLAEDTVLNCECVWTECINVEVYEVLTVTITVVESTVLDGDVLHICLLAEDEYLTSYTDAVECTAVNLYVVKMASSASSINVDETITCAEVGEDTVLQSQLADRLGITSLDTEE